MVLFVGVAFGAALPVAPVPVSPRARPLRPKHPHTVSKLHLPKRFKWGEKCEVRSCFTN
jgi:hypothetical protein